MTVYVLLCFYDNCTELHGVFDSVVKAANKAQQMEQANQVEIGSWTIRSETVQ